MSYAISRLGGVALMPIRSRGQLGKIATLALIFAGAVVFGNISLRYIPISFNQALGATTPAFTAAISAALLGHREAGAVYAALVPVVVGIVIASGAEPLFNLFGFAAALTATAGRALKSVLQGAMLADSAEKMDSMSLLAYMAPVAAAALVPVVAWYEPAAPAAALAMAAESRGFWALLAFNSFLAYFVNLTNFLVTKHTSALTLQVLGNAKGVVAVVVSVLCFRNPVTVYSMLGYGVTVGGVVLYSRAKSAARRRGPGGGAGRPPLGPGGKLASYGSDVAAQMEKGSPFVSTAAGGGGGSGGERQPLLGASGSPSAARKAAGEGLAPVNGHGRTLSASAMSSASSFGDRIMARGFSSIFEA